MLVALLSFLKEGRAVEGVNLIRETGIPWPRLEKLYDFTRHLDNCINSLRGNLALFRLFYKSRKSVIELVPIRLSVNFLAVAYQ